MVGNRIEAVGCRTKVPITLINHWCCAINVLKAIDAKAIICITDKGAMLSRRFDVVARGSFVIMVSWSQTHRRSDMTSTEQWDARRVHIVALSLARPLYVHAIEMHTHLLPLYR